MAELIELTTEEAAVIRKLRAEQDQRSQENGWALEFLKVAFDFKQWLDKAGTGATYSTFCDDYGYEGEHRKRVYESSLELIKLAMDLAHR